MNETQRGYGLWQGIRIRIAHSDDTTTDATTCTTDAVSDIDDELGFQSLFKAVGVEIEIDKLTEWLNSDANDRGVQIYTDSEICECLAQKTALNTQMTNPLMKKFL